MSTDTNLFDTYIINSILANNQFGITAVTDIENINTGYFIKEEYGEVEKLIAEKNVHAIKSLRLTDTKADEFLTIMIFKDQRLKEYIVTVYDSNALEQDPQVIEIYPL